MSGGRAMRHDDLRAARGIFGWALIVVGAILAGVMAWHFG